MKNEAIDLHNILFEQLERLNDLDDKEEVIGNIHDSPELLDGEK